MANEKKIDLVILGFLHHEPMTGYDIKKRIDNELKYFFNGSFGSIYPALNSLEKADYITKKEVCDSGRGRIVYDITGQGEQYLRDWLKQEGAKDELRYETLLKIFFGACVDRECILMQIESFEQKALMNLKMLQYFENNLEGVIDESEDHLYFLLTVRFGIETYKGQLNWCKAAKMTLGDTGDGSN